MKNSLLKIKHDFINWTKIKVRHHVIDYRKEVYFREKEVWWTALGKNIGYEIDGKQELFERPVLILKKYSKDMCFVLPLTSKIKNKKTWYQVEVEINGKKSAVNITQGRTIAKARLLRKFGIIEKQVFNEIIEKFILQFK